MTIQVKQIKCEVSLGTQDGVTYTICPADRGVQDEKSL